MANTKNTKRALVSSVMALFLCFAMLLGTTYAWFTDSVSSGVNIIAAGNLDVELYHESTNTTNEKVNGTTALFDDVTPDLWEPGAMAWEKFTVANEGTLALKYQFALNVTDATVVNNISFAEMLKVAVVDDTFVYTRENVEAITEWSNLASFIKESTLAAGDAYTFGIVIWWQPSDLDNNFNMKDVENEGKTVSVTLGVELKATQLTAENDSFGNDYDTDAALPEAITDARELANKLTANEEEINVTLYSNIDLPISSLGQQTGGSGEYKLGGEDTKSIVIDLNGHNLNITTTYWSAIGAKNPDATITIKNGTMTSSQATGTWNSYDLTFSNCNYVFENVTFDKAVALANTGKSVDMNNVVINETHDYYALWICAEGQDVEINGLTINSDGRGIKIDEQYSGDAVAKVNLSISNAVINSNKKAAIIVKSVAGADIVLNNVDINNVAEDPFNEVWVDEDAAAYADLVFVTGGKVVVEGSADVPVMVNPANVQDRINSALVGATVVLTEGTYTNTIVMKSNITLLGTDGAVVHGINLNGSDNVTIKNVNFDAAGAKQGYDNAGAKKQYANIFTGDNINSQNKGAWNLVIDGCTFTGTFANGGAAIEFADYHRGGGFSGNVTIKNCTFDTVGGYYDIYSHYTGDSSNGHGDFIIENNTFASEDLLAGHVYLGRYASSTPVVVTGNTFENAASINEAMYVQDHSSYGVSINATNNTFNS